MFEQYIIPKLKALNKNFKKSGDNFLLSQCLSPNHLDKHNSFSINTETGFGHCFTCGYKVDKDFWINGKISPEMKEEIERRSKYQALKEQLKNEEETLNPVGLPFKDEECPENYRGLTKETIDKFKLYKCNTGKYKNRIIFPFLNEPGFTSRTLEKNSRSKYLHNKGFNNKLILYPYSILQEAKPNFVVLVEGIMDCISLWQDTIPSICNFGIANVFSNTKIGKLLECGVETIYVMFDEDKAGQEAKERILNDKKLKEYFEVKDAKELKVLEKYYKSDYKDFNEYLIRNVSD